MARRLAALFALLAVLTLGMAPFASASHCPMDMAGHGMAIPDEQPPCCPDMAPGDSCQIGCVQLVVAPVPALAGKLPQHARYGMAAPVIGTDWIAPPETEPPRLSLRS